ncbi:MAG: hypothetical protein ACRBCL_12990 [Maritimibacter sp.]
MTPDITAIHQLGIKGFGKTDALAESMGMSEADLAPVLARLEQDGLTSPTRVGVRLSPDGKARYEAIVAQQRGALDADRLEAEHDQFVPLNAAFKTLVTDWQMREVDGAQVINDHSDPAYDAAIRDRLGPVHEGISALLTQMAEHVPHMAQYIRRFDGAIARFQGGEEKYLTAPIIDSYHTVWFELHQDMIGLLGRSRAAEAQAGRAV